MSVPEGVWTCGECNTTYAIPVKGGMNLCCVKNLMADAASDVIGEKVDPDDIQTVELE